MPKADTDRPCANGSGAFMGKGRAVKSGPDGNPTACQNLRRRLTVHPRPEGHSPRLMGAGEYLHTQFFQARGTAFHLLLFPFQNSIHTGLFDIAKALVQAGNSRHIQGKLTTK